MNDILAMGELLVDFSPAGENSSGIALYARNPGGAPANVLAMAAKLGSKTALIAKVGNDSFGDYLEQYIGGIGIDTQGLIRDDRVPTTLAFVHINAQHERSFSFYRDPGADSQLTKSDVNPPSLCKCAIFHFGSVSLTNCPVRETTLWAAQQARKNGAIVSFDPNYRPLLWDREVNAQTQIRTAIKLSDIVKISDEELALSTGYENLEDGAQFVLDNGASAVVVSLGARGSVVCTRKVMVSIDAFPVKTVDTTGAGDAFWGAVLNQLQACSIQDIQDMDDLQWRKILRFANAAGALTAMALGAIPAMPSLQDIAKLVDDENHLLD